MHKNIKTSNDSKKKNDEEEREQETVILINSEMIHKSGVISFWIFFLFFFVVVVFILLSLSSFLSLFLCWSVVKSSDYQSVYFIITLSPHFCILQPHKHQHSTQSDTFIVWFELTSMTINNNRSIFNRKTCFYYCERDIEKWWWCIK